MKALFAGLPLAVRFREFSTDGGIAGFAVNRTVVKFDGQVHWDDVEAFYREGKGPPEGGLGLRIRITKSPGALAPGFLFLVGTCSLLRVRW